MRNAGIGLLIALALALTAYLRWGAWSRAEDGPVFDRVWIARGSADAGVFHNHDRPDGGFRLRDVTAAALLERAFPPETFDIEGLPGWARAERFDVAATSTLTRPGRRDRQAMVRAMLADRFKLSARVAPREHPAYDLVVARSDGRLGPGLRRLAIDCPGEAERTAGIWPPTRPLADPHRDPVAAACTVRLTDEGQLEGGVTLPRLAALLARPAGRSVIDRTGLRDSYHVTLPLWESVVMWRQPRVGQPRALPLPLSVSLEQLGLRLVPSRIVRPTVIVERLERPAAN
jgi:uncharacterized protein (TIGR03435 family)